MSSRSKGTTQNKHKACRNQIMCFFPKMTLYFVFKYFLLVLSDVKSYGYTKLIFTLFFLSSKDKKNNIEKTQKTWMYWILTCEQAYIQTFTLAPIFNNHIFFILSDISGHGCAKLCFKKSFSTWKAKDGYLRSWNALKT